MRVSGATRKLGLCDRSQSRITYTSKRDGPCESFTSNGSSGSVRGCSVIKREEGVGQDKWVYQSI